MSNIYEDLVSTMSIDAGTPYAAVLMGTDDNGARLASNGAVVFSLKRGNLKYKFAPALDDASSHDVYLWRLLPASDLRLVVPSREIDKPVHTTLFPSIAENPTEGVLALECFGNANEELSYVGIKFKNLPDGWSSPDDRVRFRGWSDLFSVPDDKGNISVSGGGQEVTPAIELEWMNENRGTWTAKIRKIPTEQLDSDHNFRCTIELGGAKLTGEIAQEFLKENLRPFLQFTFAGRADNHIAVGYDNYNRPAWGYQIRDTAVDIPEDLLSRNWFLRQSRQPMVVNPQFQTFCALDTKTRNRYQRVIETYAYSEQVFSLVGSSAIAAAFSYAALDSLARVITATYPDWKDWLKDNLEVKRGKNIQQVIEHIAGCELKESEAFNEVSKIVAAIRHNTFHADPTKEPPDPIESYRQWENTQTMVEMLLLKRLGMEEIPIRASIPTWLVYGKDMLAEARQSSIAEKLANRVEADQPQQEEDR